MAHNNNVTGVAESYLAC